MSTREGINNTTARSRAFLGIFKSKPGTVVDRTWRLGRTIRNSPSVRIYCKTLPDRAMSIRRGWRAWENRWRMTGGEAIWLKKNPSGSSRHWQTRTGTYSKEPNRANRNTPSPCRPWKTTSRDTGRPRWGWVRRQGRPTSTTTRSRNSWQKWTRRGGFPR